MKPSGCFFPAGGQARESVCRERCGSPTATSVAGKRPLLHHLLHHPRRHLLYHPAVQPTLPSSNPFLREGRGRKAGGGRLHGCIESRCAGYERDGSAGGMSTLKTKKTASRTGTRLDRGWERSDEWRVTSGLCALRADKLREGCGRREVARLQRKPLRGVKWIGAGIEGGESPPVPRCQGRPLDRMAGLRRNSMSPT